MFSEHPKSKFWSEKNEKKPSDYYLNSNKCVWFDCDKCCHNFYKKIADVNSNSWCPYCANQKLCHNNECKSCFTPFYISNADYLLFSIQLSKNTSKSSSSPKFSIK